MTKVRLQTISIKPDVLKNLQRIKEEYLEEEDEFISLSTIIKKLLKETDNWKKPKPKSGRKKRESKE